MGMRQLSTIEKLCDKRNSWGLKIVNCFAFIFPIINICGFSVEIIFTIGPEVHIASLNFSLLYKHNVMTTTMTMTTLT